MSICSLFIDWPICSYKKENVECEGHRCPLGKCIPDDRVCDRKRDCHDGSQDDYILTLI